MSDKKSIYKPRPISGFPEWLPEVRLVEQQWFDHIRRVFESYGFCSIETPSVEEIGVLEAKGEVDKEIYVLERLHREEGDKEARLALHFDQTVPLARYVAQNFNELVFPFKRYQMQRVWRGERPQLGRSREFYQCDIDVIGVDALPLHFDAEMPAVIYEAMTGLNIGRIEIRISNRKILLGLVSALGIEDPVITTRTIDKMEKIGQEKTVELLKIEAGLKPAQINEIMALCNVRGGAADLPAKLAAIQPHNDAMAAGLKELTFVMESLRHLPNHAVVGDLSIVRGLDYYTGTVYETRLLDIPEFTSSVCSGGRYDDLAGGYINKHLPGVGISIGFTRLFEVLHHFGHIKKDGPKSPTHILVILPSEERRGQAAATAQTLRERGYNVELFHAARKIPDQMKYASRKGIPFVWFPPFDDAGRHEVKDMTTGQQAEANPDKWEKP